MDETFALVQAAGRSESVAIRQLTERLLPVVRARVRRLQARRSDLRATETMDLVQQVFVCLLGDGAAQLRKWDPARGATLEGYVGMVTEREVGNLAQKSATRSRMEAPEPDVVDEAASTNAFETQLLQRDAALKLGRYLHEQLPPKGQVIFKCLYGDGLNTDETARVLGVERQVVYNWQHKIRLLAREFLPSFVA
jgi:RNA polymerase sigma-70 factor (ECF subfamily)